MEQTLDRRVKRFLRAIADGKWHESLPTRISQEVADAAVELKLAQKELIPIPHTQNVLGKFRITQKGRKALVTGKGPDKEQVNETVEFGEF